MVTVPLLSQSPGLVSADLAAVHFAVDPPFAPSHVQLHGPVPVTAVGAPVVQKLVVGAVVNVPLSLLPQVPLTGAGVKLAEHVAVAPPLVPVHVQFHGPVPVIVVAVPVLQKLIVGAVVNVPLSLEPQAPFTAIRLKVAEIVWLAVTLVIL